MFGLRLHQSFARRRSDATMHKDRAQRPAETADQIIFRCEPDDHGVDLPLRFYSTEI